MINSQTKFNRSESGKLANHPEKVAAAIGFVAGMFTKSLTIEVFAHQELAHHNLKGKPWIGKLSRAVLSAYGFSPNKFALRHRVHHRQKYEEPCTGFFRTIIGTIATSGLRSKMIDPSDPRARDWSTNNDFKDPLLIKTSEGSVLRKNPVYERMAAKGGPGALIPPVIGSMAVYTTAKLLGAKRPASTAVSFCAASFAPMAIQPALTALAETRAGIDDGRVNVERLGPVLSGIVEPHNEHHQAPEKPYVGITPVDRLVIATLKATGQIEEIDGMYESRMVAATGIEPVTSGL